MKRTILFSSVLLFLAASGASGADEAAAGSSGVSFGVDFRFGGVILGDDCWDDSLGAAGDVGLVFWAPGETVGVWAGVGAQSASMRWTDSWGELESDVVAVPVGASLLLRAELSDGFALVGEAGVRYVAVDVDDWDEGDRHHRRRDAERDRYFHPERYLDVDDTSLAVAGLQLEYADGPFRLGVGGGYQFDLEKPDVSYLGNRIGRLDLSGAFVCVTVGFRF